MKIWSMLKKIHDKIFLWFIPQEILLNFGSEQRIQAQTFSNFAMLCFLGGLPNVLYVTLKFPEIIGWWIFFLFLLVFTLPLILFQIQKNINVSIVCYVIAVFLFLNGVYLFIDKPISPILNWHLILFYFAIVTVRGKAKNIFLFAQILLSVVTIVVKFKYGELFQLVQIQERADLGRLLGSLLFTSICTYLLTKVFLQMQLLGQEHKETKENSDLLENRLKATQSLAAGLAHEINNPLTILNGSLVRLQKNIDNPEGLMVVKQAVDQSIRAANRIAFIIKRLTRWISFEDSLDPKRRVFIEDIVHSALSTKRERLHKQATKLEMQIDNQEVPLKLSLLEFVLDELIENAIEFAEEKSKSESKSEAAQLSLANIFIKVSFDFGWCHIQVGNTGVEIKKEYEQAIFDPFYSRKGQGHGNGIGLAVAFSIVNRLNGKLTVKREDLYTVFSIHVPVIIGESGRTADSTGAA